MGRYFCARACVFPHSEIFCAPLHLRGITPLKSGAAGCGRHMSRHKVQWSLLFTVAGKKLEDFIDKL